MIIPWQELDNDTLRNLIESFVLREGTDYGDAEVDLATKVDQVMQQLKNDKIQIVYSELHESVDFQPKRS